MSTLVNCPKCKSEIENDSFYCDQCGVELYICTKCHIFGKGKRCTQCGQALVSAQEAAGGLQQDAQQSTQQSPNQSSQQSASSQQASQQSAPMQSGADAQSVDSQNLRHVSPSSVPDAEKTIRPGMSSVPLPLRLVCAEAGIRLGLGDGAVIGRRGDYSSVFSSYSYVSGAHARLQQTPSYRWEIVDLDSTNGTFVNGARLEPNVPMGFGIGDIISIANLEFRAE